MGKQNNGACKLLHVTFPHFTLFAANPRLAKHTVLIPLRDYFHKECYLLLSEKKEKMLWIKA